MQREIDKFLKDSEKEVGFTSSFERTNSISTTASCLNRFACPQHLMPISASAQRLPVVKVEHKCLCKRDVISMVEPLSRYAHSLAERHNLVHATRQNECGQTCRPPVLVPAIHDSL